MASFSKKFRQIADPLGSAVWRYAGKRSGHIKKWDKQLHSWGYLRKKLMKPFRFGDANSASQVQNDVYGHTGSIVGRF